MPAKIVDRKEKVCSRCKNLLPMSEFYVTAKLPTGTSQCRVCQSEMAKQRRLDDPEKWKAVAAKAGAKWAAAHPDQHAALHKKSKADYYARNSDDLKRKIAVWQAANPEIVRISKKLNRQKRRAKMKGQHIPAWMVQRLFELFEGMCAYCRVAKSAHVDHIMPLSKGGDHSIENIAPACARCNQTKNASLPAVFQAKSGYDVQAVIRQVSNLNFN